MAEWRALRDGQAKSCASLVQLLEGSADDAQAFSRLPKVRKKSVKEAAQQVRGQAAKVGLFLVEETTLEETTGVLAQFAESLDVFVSWCRGMMASVGPTMQHQIRGLAVALVGSAARLIEGALSEGGGKPSADLKVLAAVVFQRCDEVGVSVRSGFPTRYRNSKHEMT